VSSPTRNDHALLIASTSSSLDGVMHAPGGPGEAPSGGSSFGDGMCHFLCHFRDATQHIGIDGRDGKDRARQGSLACTGMRL